MSQDFYRRRLEDKHGLRVLVPSESDRELVHRVIYDELCHGVVRDESRQEYLRVIQALGQSGAQCVILGCTEIVQLIDEQSAGLPAFDTTRLHAEGAVNWALAKR